MADPIYAIPENPIYDPEIRALQDSDPARASTILNPPIEKIINNVHAVKLAGDKLAESVATIGDVQDLQKQISDLQSDVGVEFELIQRDKDEYVKLFSEQYQTLETEKANINSPDFMGIPRAPTAAKQISSQQIATTEYVKMQFDNASFKNAAEVINDANYTIRQILGPTEADYNSMNNYNAIHSIHLGYSYVPLEICALKLKFRRSVYTTEAISHDVFHAGASLIPTADNNIDVGSASNRLRNIYATSGTINTSDINDKTDVEALEEQNAINFIKLLNPVSHKFKDGGVRTHYGLISQEVKNAMDTMQMTDMDFAGWIRSPKLDDGDETGEFTYGLRYTEFIPLLIKVVQSQEKRIVDLTNQVNKLARKLKMDYKYSCVVNADGFYKTFVLVLLEADEQRKSHENIQHYTLNDDETLVDVDLPDIKTHAGTEGFIRPRWNGEAWTEGATLEEIVAWEVSHPAPSSDSPTPLEMLVQENKLLKAQITAESDRADFIEDCIAEMATQVYIG